MRGRFGKALPRLRSGKRRSPGRSAGHGRGRDPAGDRGGCGGVRFLASEPASGAGGGAVALGGSDALFARGARHAGDARAGETARAGARRSGARGGFRRVVRRRREAHLRRDHADQSGRPAFPRAASAGGRVRGDHAVEFSCLDDHAQGGAGAGGGLHRGGEAGRADAAHGPGARAARRAGGHAARGARCRHRRRSSADRPGAHVRSSRAQDFFHRLDRGRAAADGAKRCHAQAPVAGAGRGRSLSRVRRRGCGGRGAGGDRLEIPQFGADLRVRQPHPGAGGDL